jgi:hypothetical protein
LDSERFIAGSSPIGAIRAGEAARMPRGGPAHHHLNAKLAHSNILQINILRDLDRDQVRRLKVTAANMAYCYELERGTNVSSQSLPFDLLVMQDVIRQSDRSWTDT